MTTVLVDKNVGYIAADRMATSNDCEVAISCSKILELELDGERFLAAGAGLEGVIEHMVEWFESGDWDSEPLDVNEDDDSTLVLLSCDTAKILVVDKWLRPYEIDSRWYAAGTGGPFAWAIVEAGCGVEKAMKTAVAMDPNSGFGYDVQYVKD